jgi:secondary thiamine-phosphate synthase enzyme
LRKILAHLLLHLHLSVDRSLITVTIHSEQLQVRTSGKGTVEITDDVARAVAKSGIASGTATVFVQHTSCSLIIMENADPSARRDLEEYFDRLVPEDAPYFEHTAEGSDDMPSHIRMVLTRSSEVIPIAQGRMQLGTWQGIFLFEHRRAPHRRTIIVTVMGEPSSRAEPRDPLARA